MTIVTRTTILALALGVAMALFPSTASAGERKVTREMTRTGPGGNSLQRSGQRVVDPDSRSVTRSSGTVFPDGTSRSRTRTTTRNEDGSYSVQGERSNRAGETKSFSGTWVPE